MFDVKNILYDQITRQYTCNCQCNSSADAEFICAKYLIATRTFDSFGEIYSKDSVAIISASSPNTTATIANYVNANYFMPPLDVYVFYGSSQKGLESRWCVGFDITNALQLINLLNRQAPFINADNFPQNWFDKNGTSYSVVMLTGVMEHKPIEESAELLNQRITLCLNAIKNTTARNLNLITSLQYDIEAFTKKGKFLLLPFNNL